MFRQILRAFLVGLLFNDISTCVSYLMLKLVFFFLYMSSCILTYFFKLDFFQAMAGSKQLYGCITWTLINRIDKRLDGNYTRMLQAILKKSWLQHHTKQPLYVHLLPISKPIEVRRTRHAWHCWRSKVELVTFYYGPLHMDVPIWLIRKNLFTKALCGQRISFGRSARSIRW